MLKSSLLIGAGTISPMVLSLHLSFLPFFPSEDSRSFMGGVVLCFVSLWVDLRAVGMVWDARDLVGLMNEHFSVYI